MGENKQVFKNLVGETVLYRATTTREKEAVVAKQVNDTGAVILKVKVDDPSDRLHGFSDEEINSGVAERFSTHGTNPGQWTIVVQDAAAAASASAPVPTLTPDPTSTSAEGAVPPVDDATSQPEQTSAPATEPTA